MEWKDKGLILGVRKHGETSAIVEIMTEQHGRHLGLVRGGRSSRMRPVLQIGNSVHVEWRARLEEHLGTFQIEGDQLRAAELMDTPLGIYGLQTIAGHLRLLPERDAHLGLYRAALVMLEHLDEPEKAARMLIRFELAMLDELGFGLDLHNCAATNSHLDLAWVSPKSGRAVCSQAGKPYESQLLALPYFLVDEKSRPNVPALQKSDPNLIKSGFELSLFFLQRNVYGPRGIKAPDERIGLIKKVMRLLGEAPLVDKER